MIARNAPCPCGSGKKFKTCCGQRGNVICAPTRQRVAPPALIVCMPTRGKVSIETVTALSRLDGFPAVMRTVSRMPVAQARNALAAMAKAVPSVANLIPSAWYVLWVDDDAFWRAGTVAKLIATVTDNPQVDVLAGWFGPRKEHACPAVRYANGSWPRPGTDCEFGDVVEVQSIGFHFVLHKMDVLDRVSELPFALDRNDVAEDFAFSRRCREAGLRMFVHTGAEVAHIGDDGTAYLPGEPPYTIVNGELRKSEQPTVHSYGYESGLKVADSLRVHA